MTLTTPDELARAELLMSAVRLALSREPGDPDRILKAVAHPSLDLAATYSLFAVLLETASELISGQLAGVA